MECCRVYFLFAILQASSNTTHSTYTIPLYTYYNHKYRDYANVAMPSSIDLLQRAEYKFVRIEGYVYYDGSILIDGTVATALNLYWSEEKHDYFLTGCAEDVENATKLGYQYLGVEGYSPVEYTEWNSQAPDGCPFQQSPVLSNISFSPRYGAYGGADTWYPSWASDDNLYSSWTDGICMTCML